MAQVLAPVGGGSNVGKAITLGDGGYMVVWTHLVTNLLPIANVTDDKLTAVLGRVFNADGTPRGEVFQVNQSLANSGQGQADLALLSNGNVAVVWTDGPSLESPFDVAARGRVISATGAPVSDEFDLSAATDRDQRIPQVVATENGGFFASWSDGRSPWSNTNEQWLGQQFDANADRVGPEIWLRNDSRSEDSELVRLADGTFALIASQGVVFDTALTGFYQDAIERPSKTSNLEFASPDIFGFEDGAATDGNGNVVTVSPFTPFALTVNLYSLTERLVTGQNAPDGSPTQVALPTLTGPSEFVSSSVTLGFVGFNVRPPGVSFTPQSQFSPSAAATFMPNGNIAVVWTGVSGGTAVAPQFSVYAQILSKEGIILSDLTVIESANVQGTDIFPPFVSAGADGQLFIGWTGTTDRNGAGTNEVLGGVFDIPTYDLSTITPSGAFGTAGEDVVVGTPFTPEGDDLAILYLLDGNDTWTEGQGSGQVFGMGGDDRFIFTGTGQFNIQAVPGLGRDTFDFSLMAVGRELPEQSISNRGNGSLEPEVVIGTLLADTASVSGGTVSQGRLLHTEAGDDVIAFFPNTGMTVDGGDGVDAMTTFTRRAEWLVEFRDTHYTLTWLATPTAPPDPERTLTIRAVERIVFADQTIELRATASLSSGGAANSPVVPSPITGTPGADPLNGTADADTIDGLGGNDTILGNDGNDVIRGGDGNDFIGGGAGNDFIDGGAGNNTIFGGLGNDTVQGGEAYDEIYGSAGRNQLFGNGGNDFIQAGTGGDFIGGGAGNDTVRGGDGADTIYAGLGNDNIGGGAGNDVIFGSAGNNIIYAGFGNDTVQGGSGSDTIYGSAGVNQLLGNDGNDVIYTSAAGDFAAGGAGSDSIFGSDGADTIYAGLGDDFIGGGAGNDAIFAGAGANRIFGGLGSDTITAGSGKDVITGGPGADVFVFASAAAIGLGAGRDVITDFTAGVDDIDLRALGTTFNGTAGVLGGGTASFFYFAAGGLLIGDQNGDGAADWVLELTGAPGVMATDFIL